MTFEEWYNKTVGHDGNTPSLQDAFEAGYAQAKNEASEDEDNRLRNTFHRS